jgi:hypothetical protein
MQRVDWSMIGVFVMIVIFLFGLIYNLQQAQISEIRNDLSEIKEIKSDISEIDGRLNIVSMYLVRSGMPIYGSPQENESDSRDISISNPINGSFVNQTFSVQGKANLSNLDNIYVLSKIKGKYWILTEGISDQLGNWEAMKDCFIPIENNSGCKRYELLAIITKNPLGIGATFDEIPDYLATSNTTYVKKC